MNLFSKLFLLVAVLVFSVSVATTTTRCQPTSEAAPQGGPLSLRWEHAALPPSRLETRSFFMLARILVTWRGALWVALPGSGERLPHGGLVRLDPARGTMQSRWRAPAALPLHELVGLMPSPDDSRLAVVYRTGTRLSERLVVAIAGDDGWVREPVELAGPAPVALLGLTWVDGAVELAVARWDQGCNQATIVRLATNGDPVSRRVDVASTSSPAFGHFCAPDAAWRLESGEWRFLVRRSRFDLSATGYWAVSLSGTEVVAEGLGPDVFEDVDFAPLGRIHRLDGLAGELGPDGRARPVAPPAGAGRNPALINWRYAATSGGLRRQSCWIEADETVFPAPTGVSLANPVETDRLLCVLADVSLAVSVTPGGEQLEVRRWIDEGQALIGPAVRIDAGCLHLSRAVPIARERGGYWLVDAQGCAASVTIPRL